jgi:hypothetical protein
MVLQEAIPEPVDPSVTVSPGGADDRLRAGVDLDAGKDALLRKNLGDGVPSELF